MLRRTGELAVGAGIYHSNCKCRMEHKVRPGDRFPNCPKCHHAVTWMFTRSVHSEQQPEVHPPSDG